MPTTERGTAPTVRTCYDLLTVVPACGMTDFTDGKYIDDRNDRAAYLAAQERQAEYLVGSSALRAGHAAASISAAATGEFWSMPRGAGAKPIGITISPPQVADCRARGLDVRELNYREYL